MLREYNVSTGENRNLPSPPPTPQTDVSRQEAFTETGKLFDQVMAILQNGYTDAEVKTFPIKKGAAENFTSGVANVVELKYLEQLEQSTGPLAQASRANKIIEAEKFFIEHAGELESLLIASRNQLGDGIDNRPVVDALRAAYNALPGVSI